MECIFDPILQLDSNLKGKVVYKLLEGIYGFQK